MKHAITVSAVVLLCLLGVLAFVEYGGRWPVVENPLRQGEGLDPAAVAQGRFEHSEEAVGRLIREPQNTWSNLAFVLAGAYLACTAKLKCSRMVGAALIAIGIGSFVYHASASRTLRHLDVVGMYGLFFAMSVLAVASVSTRLRTCTESKIWFVSALTLGFSVVVTVSRNVVIAGTKPLALSTVTAVAAGVFISAIVFLTWRQRSWPVGARTGTAIILFIGAAVCQVGDRPGGWLLAPGAPLQAHAAWHVLAAAALFIAVRLVDSHTQPKQALQPTPMLVTPRADARVAPSTGVVDL